jgi:hypothetical protein
MSPLHIISIINVLSENMPFSLITTVSEHIVCCCSSLSLSLLCIMHATPQVRQGEELDAVHP